MRETVGVCGVREKDRERKGGRKGEEIGCVCGVCVRKRDSNT